MDMIAIVSVVIAILLWLLVAVLAFIAAMRSKALFREGAFEGGRDFLVLIPRVMIGVVGSGYIAAIMPQDLIAAWIGPNSGVIGILIATIVGAATPGGAVVGFAIGAAALKSGAGAPQVIAYSTAWALYAMQRVVLWEMPVLPARFVMLRALVSLPVPFLAALGAMLLGKP